MQQNYLTVKVLSKSIQQFQILALISKQTKDRADKHTSILKIIFFVRTLYIHFQMRLVSEKAFVITNGHLNLIYLCILTKILKQNQL